MTATVVLIAWGLLGSIQGQATAQPAWRGVWEWSMDKQSDADLDAIADSARDLGFNVLMMSPPEAATASMAERCRERGLKLYLSTVFNGGEPEWRQVMTPAQLEQLERPVPDRYQHGGEPLSPEEVFRGRLPCWRRPEARDRSRTRVIASAQQPVDGLAFDMVGYANYRCCHCALCEAAVDEHRRRHPHVSEAEASAVCAEQALVDFTNDMAGAAREANPEIELTTHVYPYFRPNPCYGYRLNLDTVGETVAWFFQPHWPLAKVRRLTRRIVTTQQAVYPGHLAAPFVGFYSDPPRDARSAERVAAELGAVATSGAMAVQMAELGHLVRAPEVARAVAEALGGAPAKFGQAPEG